MFGKIFAHHEQGLPGMNTGLNMESADSGGGREAVGG